MSSKWRERLRHTLGFRLALWYAAIFVASSLALIGLTYLLVALAAPVRPRDHPHRAGAVRHRLSGAAASPGCRSEIQRTQATAAPGPLLVRTVGARQAVTFLSRPEDWRHFDLSRLEVPVARRTSRRGARSTPAHDGGVLEVASVRLRDGTLFQVGMSTERRDELLERFRRVLLFNVLSLIFVGLAGGAVLTSSALQPVRRLADTVRAIHADRPHRRARARAGHRRRARRAQRAGQRDARSHRRRARRHARRARQRRPRSADADDAPARHRRDRAAPPTIPAMLREALADCLEESDRVVAMLNTLMDISEAETGTMTLRREPTDLNDLIRQSVELYEDRRRGASASRSRTSTAVRAGRRRRSQPDAAGARQPARQRAEVHAGRRSRRPSRRPGTDPTRC